MRLTSAPISDRPITQMTVPATSGGKNRTSIENGLAMSKPNTPEMSIAPYTAVSPYLSAITIIGLSTVNVAPATTGRRTPKTLPIPTLWITVAMPETNRSALTSSPMVDVGSPSAPPTMSGTATAPAYMMNRCCRPRTNRRGAGSTSSTGWTGGFPRASGAAVAGASVSDMSAPVALSAGTVRPAGLVFRIVKTYFRITDKLTPAPREVKREKEIEHGHHPRAGYVAGAPARGRPGPAGAAHRRRANAGRGGSHRCRRPGTGPGTGRPAARNLPRGLRHRRVLRALRPAHLLPGGRGHLPRRGSRRPLPCAAGPQPLRLLHLPRQLARHGSISGASGPRRRGGTEPLAPAYPEV